MWHVTQLILHITWHVTRHFMIDWYVTNVIFVVRKQISELEQKIEKLERELTVLSRAEKREEVIQKVVV